MCERLSSAGGQLANSGQEEREKQSWENGVEGGDSLPKKEIFNGDLNNNPESATASTSSSVKMGAIQVSS